MPKEMTSLEIVKRQIKIKRKCRKAYEIRMQTDTYNKERYRQELIKYEEEIPNLVQIQLDLERKEKLEKENTKLKKAIEIIHREFELYVYEEYDDEEPINSNFVLDTKWSRTSDLEEEEYNLIKEVLKILKTPKTRKK